MSRWRITWLYMPCRKELLPSALGTDATRNSDIRRSFQRRRALPETANQPACVIKARMLPGISGAVNFAVAFFSLTIMSGRFPATSVSNLSPTSSSSTVRRVAALIARTGVRPQFMHGATSSPAEQFGTSMEQAFVPHAILVSTQQAYLTKSWCCALSFTTYAIVYSVTSVRSNHISVALGKHLFEKSRFPQFPVLRRRKKSTQRGRNMQEFNRMFDGIFDPMRSTTTGHDFHETPVIGLLVTISDDDHVLALKCGPGCPPRGRRFVHGGSGRV